MQTNKKCAGWAESFLLWCWKWGEQRKACVESRSGGVTVASLPGSSTLPPGYTFGWTYYQWKKRNQSSLAHLTEALGCRDSQPTYGRRVAEPSGGFVNDTRWSICCSPLLTPLLQIVAQLSHGLDIKLSHPLGGGGRESRTTLLVDFITSWACVVSWFARLANLSFVWVRFNQRSRTSRYYKELAYMIVEAGIHGQTDLGGKIKSNLNPIGIGWGCCGQAGMEVPVRGEQPNTEMLSVCRAGNAHALFKGHPLVKLGLPT